MEAYRTMASNEPDRWVVIDGSGTVDEVSKKVINEVELRLGKHARD